MEGFNQKWKYVKGSGWEWDDRTPKNGFPLNTEILERFPLKREDVEYIWLILSKPSKTKLKNK